MKQSTKILPLYFVWLPCFIPSHLLWDDRSLLCRPGRIMGGILGVLLLCVRPCGVIFISLARKSYVSPSGPFPTRPQNPAIRPQA